MNHPAGTQQPNSGTHEAAARAARRVSGCRWKAMDKAQTDANNNNVKFDTNVGCECEHQALLLVTPLVLMQTG